jgi:hypothetical protein
MKGTVGFSLLANGIACLRRCRWLNWDVALWSFESGLWSDDREMAVFGEMTLHG